MNYAVTVSRMGVWPPDACLQGLASNHPMLLRPKAVVVSDGEKADLIRQVSDEKVSASKPLMTHRNGFQLLSKRVAVGTARISVDVTCLRSSWQPVYRRHELITPPPSGKLSPLPFDSAGGLLRLYRQQTPSSRYQVGIRMPLCIRASGTP